MCLPTSTIVAAEFTAALFIQKRLLKSLPTSIEVGNESADFKSGELGNGFAEFIVLLFQSVSEVGSGSPKLGYLNSILDLPSSVMFVHSSVVYDA